MAVAILGNIYGKANAKIERHWVYESETKFNKCKIKNKLGPHYDYLHPQYGRLDLTLSQFPNEYFLLFIAYKTKFGFNSANEISSRWAILFPTLLELLQVGVNQLTSPTPEFVKFVNKHRR